MKITATLADGKSAITVEGDLLISSVAAAKPEILAALAACSEVEFDLGQVGDCDTAGLQLLLMARASARVKGKRFSTTAQSASFQAAVKRAGIPEGCFESREGKR